MFMQNEGLLIPLGGLAVGAIAIISGVVGDAHQKRLKADQRLAMLQRGMPVADIERLLGAKDDPEAPRDPLRRITNTRTTAIVLISAGFGLVLFFVLLSIIVSTHEVLAGAAAGLIPLAIGVGFAVDYRLQARELARLGLDLPGTPDRHPDRLR